MAIQIVCMNCSLQFLLCSNNTEDIPIEFDNRKLEVVCPHCAYINYEFLWPVESKSEMVLTPREYRRKQEAAVQPKQQFFIFYFAEEYISSPETDEAPSDRLRVMMNTVRQQCIADRRLFAKVNLKDASSGIGGIFGGVTT